MMEAKNIQEYIVESNYNDFIDVLGNEKIGKLYYKLLRIALDCSNHPEKHYKNHVIYKKDGSERRISIPDKTISRLQKWIKKNALDQIQISDAAFAYAKGRSGKDAAIKHYNYMKDNPGCTMLHLDIRDFFNSITAQKVYECLKEELNVEDELITFITNIVCLNGRVPQGATTSPVLSNICFKEVDHIIGNYTKSNGMIYTRYSDDMYISFREEKNTAKDIIKFIKDTVNKHGYRLNTRKTRVIRKGQRYAVLGINTEMLLQTSKRYRSNIRQEMYYVKKHGIEEHMRYRIPLNSGIGYNEQLCLIDDFNLIDTQRSYLQRIKGKIQYCLFVNPDDKEMQQYFQEIITLIDNLENAEIQTKCKDANQTENLFEHVEKLFESIDMKYGYPEWHCDFNYDEFYIDDIGRYLKNSELYTNIKVNKTYISYELLADVSRYNLWLRIINCPNKQIIVDVHRGELPLTTIKYDVEKDIITNFDMLAIEMELMKSIPEIKEICSENYSRAMEVGKVISKYQKEKMQ